MKKTTTTVVATLALGLALSACTTNAGGVATPAPMTETVKEEAAPEPRPGLSDSDLQEIGKLAIELAWNDMNLSEQEDICWLFGLDEGAVLDAVMDVEDNALSRSDVRSFFARKC